MFVFYFGGVSFCHDFPLKVAFIEEGVQMYHTS